MNFLRHGTSREQTERPITDPPQAMRNTTDTDIERVVRRYGWVWAAGSALLGAIVWIVTVAFSMGAASTKYVTVETRAKDQAVEIDQREKDRQSLQSISERTTRIEEQNKAMSTNIQDIKESVGRLKR
jgi:preprotein translocase subunit SecF